MLSVVAASCGGGAELSPSDRAWLTENLDRLRVGQHRSMPPYSKVDADGRWTGVAVDMFEAIEAQLGVRFGRSEPLPGGRPHEQLASGQIQIHTCVGQTPDRVEKMLFTEPWLNSPGLIFVRADGPFHELSPSELKGKDVLAIRGYALTEHVQRTYPEVALRFVADDPPPHPGVALGDADAALVDAAAASWVIHDQGMANVRSAGYAGFTYPISIATPRSMPELHRAIVAGLAAVDERTRTQIRNRWVHLEGQPFYREPGFRWIAGLLAVLGLLALTWNRTLSRMVAARTEDLAEAQTTLADTFDSMPSALLRVDADGAVTEWNTAAARTFGVGKDDAVGRALWSVAPALEAYRPHVEAGAQVTLHRQPLEVARGETFTVTIYPLTGAPGAVLRFDDTTELVAKEQAIAKSQKMESVGLLAGGLVHDFNNVLGGVVGAVSLAEQALDDGDDPSEVAEYLGIATSSTDRAQALVRRLLSVAKGDDAPTSAEVDLSAVVEQVVSLCRSSFERSVAIEVDRGEGSVVVQGDRGQLEQVLLNLAMNARHAMTTMADGEGGGTLSITVGALDADAVALARHPHLERGRYGLISVEDDGVGMDEATRARIFDPMFTTKSSHGGTGLGMAMVSSIVYAHGGFVDVWSVPGEGTRIVFGIPTGDASTRPAECSGAGTVLLLEPDAASRAVLAAELRAGGYRVGTDEAPDVVIVDRLASEAPPAAPVVIRTGGTRKPGCDLLKPYTLADVAAAIAQSRASATKA